MTAPLTGERLAEIREREQAATEGPWVRWTDQENIPGWDGFFVVGDNADEGEECNPAARVYIESDAEFIAHAREDVPVLLAEVERLRSVVARARDMHWRFDIYDICGCREHEDEAATVTLSDGEVVCRSGYQYSICHECCAPGDSQTEECVDNHDHSECWPCPTRKALDETPSLVGSPS